jgi:hypothetical protein
LAYALPPTGEGSNWRQLSLALEKPVTITESMKQNNDMIVCIEEVKLNIANYDEKLG